MDVAYEQRRNRTLEIAKELEENSLLSPEEREQRNFSKLKMLISHAQTSLWWEEQLSPFQAEILDSKTLPQLLNSLPILERAQIQDYGQWMQTWVFGSSSADYRAMSSSGSTGKPVTVTKFAPVQSREFSAVEIFDMQWQKIDLSEPLLFYTARKPPKKNPSNFGEPLSYIGASGLMYFRNNAETPVSEVIDLIRSEAIQTILVSAVSLRMFISEVDRRGVNDLNLKQILTFADRVDPSLRAMTREILGARIIDRYSTSELGPLALQCPYFEHLHALQFANHLEILDANGRPCRPNEVGRVVVTSLSSFAMPLIRYDIGDTASWGDPCDSEITLPVLQPDIVRIRESFMGADGSIKHILPDRASFAKMTEVTDFQLLIFKDYLVLFLAGRLSLTEELRNQFGKELAEITSLNLPLKVFVIEDIDWIKRNKRRSVIRLEMQSPNADNFDAYREYLGA
jgi:phenylacetate-CoA ligase